jgi:hypothetical protein
MDWAGRALHWFLIGWACLLGLGVLAAAAGGVAAEVIGGGGALAYASRTPLRRRIDGLPQRQQDWVWTGVAVAIIAAVLVGVPLLYRLLRFRYWGVLPELTLSHESQDLSSVLGNEDPGNRACVGSESV